jgi:carnitine 3-dehydrogenase
MQRPDPRGVRRVGVIGTGVIGSGWAAHFLRMGLDVVAFDPAPGAEDRLRRFVGDAWPTLERLGLRDGAGQDRLTFATDLHAAASGVEFIQESTREDGPTKIRILADIDAAAGPATVIGSSTSGFSMTMLQRDAAHPERLVVGHPFNPPYLIPLVEVVGGERTDPAVVDWAVAFYTHVGKYGLKMTQELPGFLANRLQEAIWREALHMVASGEATVEEIDASVTYGPGLRWALMGPCLTFHLAGGQGGMGYMLDHFGAALLEPWTRLDAPELTPELRERMVEGCLREAAGRSIGELERERDEFLVELLALRERYDSRDAKGTPGA